MPQDKWNPARLPGTVSLIGDSAEKGTRKLGATWLTVSITDSTSRAEEDTKVKNLI